MLGPTGQFWNPCELFWEPSDEFFSKIEFIQFTDVNPHNMSSIEKSFSLLGLASEGTSIVETFKAYRWRNTENELTTIFLSLNVQKESVVLC